MERCKMLFFTVAAAACIAVLASVPSFAEENVGPAYAAGFGTRSENAASDEASFGNVIAADQDPEAEAGKLQPVYGTVGTVITEESKQFSKGASLGSFKIVGYSGGNRTYSGAETKPNHTVAADPDVLPIGTKIFIGDTVYTVEDIGGSVKGKMVDVFFSTLDEARALTRKGSVTAEVFSAVPVSAEKAA